MSLSLWRVVIGGQVDTMFWVHFTGATLAFGVGTVYSWLQVILSFRTCPELSHRVVCVLRLICSVAASITFILSILR